jgi:hypothetical protein
MLLLSDHACAAAAVSADHRLRNADNLLLLLLQANTWLGQKGNLVQEFCSCLAPAVLRLLLLLQLITEMITEQKCG